MKSMAVERLSDFLQELNKYRFSNGTNGVVIGSSGISITGGCGAQKPLSASVSPKVLFSLCGRVAHRRTLAEALK